MIEDEKSPMIAMNRNESKGGIFTPLMVLFLSGNGIIILAIFLQHIFGHIRWSDVLFIVMGIVGLILFLTGVIASRKRDQQKICDCQAERE